MLLLYWRSENCRTFFVCASCRLIYEGSKSQLVWLPGPKKFSSASKKWSFSPAWPASQWGNQKLVTVLLCPIPAKKVSWKKWGTLFIKDSMGRTTGLARYPWMMTFILWTARAVWHWQTKGPQRPVDWLSPFYARRYWTLGTGMCIQCMQ